MKRYLLTISALIMFVAVAGLAMTQLASAQQRQSGPPSRGTQEWSTITPPASSPSYGGYGWGGGWGNGGGTVAGNYMNGMANAVRAAGDYNLNTSAAYINLEEAKRREIQNRQDWTQAYFEMRRTNSDYRAAERGPKGTPEEWVRYAREAAPARLSPGEIDNITGQIAWPRLLQGDEFSKGRDELQDLFTDRADKGGSIGPSVYQKIQASTAKMLAVLKANIKKYPPNEYINAKNFLTSLGYEARFAGN